MSNHAGARPVLLAKEAARYCLLCAEPVHCTNLFCREHHASHCTPGGIDSDGHHVRRTNDGLPSVMKVGGMAFELSDLVEVNTSPTPRRQPHGDPK